MSHTVFITGATGFIGLNLIKRLRHDHGEDVEIVALRRPASDLKYLNRFHVRQVVGDVVDRQAVLSALPKGVDVVYHSAADVSFWSPHNQRQRQVNVGGTVNVIEAALQNGARRFVHVSSAAAYGPESGDILTEETRQRGDGHWINYFKTKWEAEREVLSAIERGLPAVIVQPANILGPLDARNWSRLFTLMKRGKLPGVLPGGAPWCHVDNVVSALLTAAERGRVGEKYLIGAKHASYEYILDRAAHLLDVKPPRKIPGPMLHALGRVSHMISLATRQEPNVTPEIAYLGTVDYCCDCSKAARELAYEELPVEVMVEDTYAWMRQECLI